MDPSAPVVTGLAVSHIRIFSLEVPVWCGIAVLHTGGQHVAMVLMGMQVVLMNLGDQRGQCAVMAVMVF